MSEMTEEVVVAASREIVWADLTDAASLAQWFWPARFETAAIVDLAVGEWTVRSTAMDMAVHGSIVAAEQSGSLRLAWRWEGEPHVTDVEITLEPAGGAATLVRVRHSGVLGEDERTAHIAGWSDCLGRLVARHSREPASA